MVPITQGGAPWARIGDPFGAAGGLRVQAGCIPGLAPAVMAGPKPRPRRDRPSSSAPPRMQEFTGRGLGERRFSKGVPPVGAHATKPKLSLVSTLPVRPFWDCTVQGNAFPSWEGRKTSSPGARSPPVPLLFSALRG